MLVMVLDAMAALVVVVVVVVAVVVVVVVVVVFVFYSEVLFPSFGFSFPFSSLFLF